MIAVLLISTGTAAWGQQPAATAEETRVVETVRAIFAAATADDLAKFHAVTTPGFYLFDEGFRFDGDTIMKLAKADHAAGKVYVWTVTAPDVHVDGDTAWIAYVNKGSVTDASGTVDHQWLESAFLKREAGVWRIAFMHSTPVPAPKGNQVK
jgi:ketosteroid isomerase-like protein